MGCGASTSAKPADGEPPTTAPAPPVPPVAASAPAASSTPTPTATTASTSVPAPAHAAEASTAAQKYHVPGGYNRTLRLTELFVLMDLSHDNVITMDELLRLGRVGMAEPSKLKALFRAADTNADGVISLDEMIAFNLETCKDLSDEAFKVTQDDTRGRRAHTRLLALARTRPRPPSATPVASHHPAGSRPTKCVCCAGQNGRDHSDGQGGSREHPRP